jgi:hypothetical protein
MKSKVQEALEQGYSPSEVLDYLSKTKWQSEQEKIVEARKEGYTDDQILNYLVTPKTGGILESGIGGAKQLLAASTTAIQTPFLSDEEVAQRAEARREKITERPGFSLDEIKKAYKEGFIPGTRELLSEIPSAISSQLPNFATMAAGAKAGAAFTPPVLPIVGPFAKPIGAALGAFGASYLPISGSQVERQIEEDKAAGRPVEIDRLSAYGTAVPSALLDVGAMQIGLGKFLGLTKLGTKTAEKTAIEALEKVAKESALKSGAVGVAKLVGAEVPTEVIQQMLERYQADLPLTTPDAIKEYTDVAAQTAALGPLGAVSRLSERGEAKNTLQLDEQRRQQTLARIDSERQRIDEIVLAAQSEAETKQAAEEAAQLAKDSLNELGNYAPEKSKIARSIKTMQTAFDKAIEQGDLDAQKKAIQELTNVPTSLVSLATMPKVVNDQTFADMGIGYTATIRRKKELHGLDPQIPAENEQIRNALSALLETKEEGSKQYEGITNYLNSIPTTQELKGYTEDETTIPEGSRESVQVSRKPMAGEIAGGIEGVDGDGVGDVATNAQQLAGRERSSDLTLISEQNRNRNVPASVAQMNDIASNPIYEKVSTDNSMVRGAPIVTGPGRLSEAQYGKEGTAIAENGTKMPFRYAVIEADQVLPSNNADGSPNPEWGKRYNGFRAVVGNGRTAGLQAGYQRGTMDEYKTKLLADDTHGINSEIIQGMNNPILVRATTEESIPNNIGQISNESATLNKSAIEQAKDDAQNISVEGLENMFNEEGDVTHQGLKQFVASVPASERANMIDTNGLPTKQAKERLNAAIFNKAYNNDELVRLQYQADTDEARNVLKALAEAAPNMSRLQGAKDYDIREQVAKAAEMVVNARIKGEKLTEASKQMDMTIDPLTRDIFNLFVKNPRSAKAMATDLKALANEIYKDSQQPAQDMFGVTQKRSVSDIIKDIQVKPQKDLLQAEKQQLGKRNPIFDKVTNGKELFKAVMKIADTRSDKAIINMLEKVPNLDTVKVITENTSTDPELQGASGYYDPNTNTIFVDPRVADLSHITLHEISHAATDAEFDKHVKIVNNVHTPITPLGKKMVKLFDAFMAESLKKQEGFYGQKNVKEFFMESYTDNKLKNFLQNRAGVLGLKPAKGKIATLWSDFVNLIKSMFGIPEYAHSMLDEILLLSPELMKGPGALTTGKEISQARVAPAGMTRPDGTPLKYVEDTPEGIMDKFREAFNGDTNQWRKWGDWLGNKIVGGRYSVERKGLDANLPEVDRFREGRIRGDLINLQAYNSMSIAQAGLYWGRLILRKSGLIVADSSSGPNKVKMIDISKKWNELVDRATQELGSKELAYDMLVAGYYGPRYAKLAEFNATANADEKVNIDEWTESDKRTAEEAYRRYGNELKELQDMRNVQRKDLLDFLVDANLYTREKAQRFLDRSEYVALYRVPEEEIETFDRPNLRGKGLLGAGKEYRLVGSKRAAADPIDNYIENMSWMMQRGIKNNAAKSTADMMQQLGVGQWYDRPMTDVEKKAYHYVTVHVNGLPKDFRVMDPNDMAAFSSSPIITGAAWDLMKYPVAGLRHGITMMPQFVWNQAWEDPIRATFTSGNKAGFLNNIKKTWKSIAINQFSADQSPNAQKLNRYGIIGQRDVLDSKDLINIYKGKDKKIWQKSLFFFERMAQGSDLGAREAIYENAVKELEAEGYDRETAEDYAAVRAHQYMPYQQMGMSRSLAYLRRMMPFVNPPIQGMARDIAAARGRIGGISRAQGKKLLVWRLTKYAIFTGMYAAFMSGDDDYEDQSEAQQDNNFFIGGLRMPVPQELRPFKVAVERGTRAWVLNAPKADIEDADVAAAVLRKSWELIAGFTPVPSIVRPLAENYTNFDLFSGLPVVSAGQQRKEPYLQYTEKTSELAKAVGAQLNYSPIKIDKLLKGYFGYLGQTIGQVTNYFSDDRAAPTANDIIFVGSMLENQRATGNRSDFYELYEKVLTAKASANALLQEGDVEGYREYVAKNKGFMAVDKPVNNLHNQITKLREYKKAIMNSNRTPEEKREAIDRLNESENNMLDNVKQLHKRAVEINQS